MSRILSLIALVLSFPVHADWTLDTSASSAACVSVKNGAVAESHLFTKLSGSVTDAGKVVVEINLASVDSAVPLRDERMRDMLFEVAKFPVAHFETELALNRLAMMPVGEGKRIYIEGTLTMHGMSAKLNIPVTIFHGAEDLFQVTTQKPVIINAATFGMDKGIEALRVVAGLTAIVPTVPVSFSLVFKKAATVAVN